MIRHPRNGNAILAIGLVVAVVVLSAGLPAAGARTAPAPAAEYVALGDSYASGEGLGSYVTGTDVKKGTQRNVCHRSAHASSTKTTGLVLPDVTSRAFWACSGATASDMGAVPPQTGTNEQFGQPAQVDMVGAATKWISITAGGDDLGFGDIGLACAEVLVNHKLFKRFSTTTCAQQLAAERAKMGAVLGNTGSVQVRLQKLYEALLRNAPQADLAVVGYPRVMPASYNGVPSLLGAPFCVLDHYPIPAATTDVGMPASDAKDVDLFVTQMNRMIEAAIKAITSADPAMKGRVRYVDTYSTSVAHNCKGTTPGATVAAFESSAFHGVGSQWKSLVSTATFHPTTTGQQMFARKLQSAFIAMRPLTAHVLRTTGQSGYWTQITGVACPAPTSGNRMWLVADAADGDGIAQELDPEWSFDVPAPLFGVGDWNSYSTMKQTLSCRQLPVSDDQGDGVFSQPPLAQMSFTQTITGPDTQIESNVTSARPGQEVIVSDGGGCGAYPGHTQRVRISLFDEATGFPYGWPFDTTLASEDTAATGRWAPMTITIPASVSAGRYQISSSCNADDGSFLGQFVTDITIGAAPAAHDTARPTATSPTHAPSWISRHPTRR